MNNNSKARFKALTKEQRRASAMLGFRNRNPKNKRGKVGNAIANFKSDEKWARRDRGHQ